MKQINHPIEIIINAIKSESYFTGTVRAGYGTSARVNIPPRYAGKKYILVILEESVVNGQ